MVRSLSRGLDGIECFDRNRETGCRRVKCLDDDLARIDGTHRDSSSHRLTHFHVSLTTIPHILLRRRRTSVSSSLHGFRRLDDPSSRQPIRKHHMHTERVQSQP